MEENRVQFEEWYKSKYLFQGYEFDRLENGCYQWVESMWEAWQASRAAMIPTCWRTYYPDTDEDSGRAHSQSGAESCAKRIAAEIGGYVIPVYYGEPQQCAAGLKIKGE